MITIGAAESVESGPEWPRGPKAAQLHTERKSIEKEAVARRDIHEEFYAGHSCLSISKLAGWQ
jgi:hypothetical protein